MVFLRPVILRDNLSPGPITNERYDYIRNEQARAKLPDHWLLPDVGGPELPQLDPLFGPRLSAQIKPAEASTQQAPKVPDPTPLSMSRRLDGRDDGRPAAPSAAPNAASQPRQLLPGGADTTGGFSDNLMLAPPKGGAAKRSTNPQP
jgi:hypothetical protein